MFPCHFLVFVANKNSEHTFDLRPIVRYGSVSSAKSIRDVTLVMEETCECGVLDRKLKRKQRHHVICMIVATLPYWLYGKWRLIFLWEVRYGYKKYA